jgi:ABC-type nitrate/sulfonate/bicarbonate transport system substrate-binding protein
MTLAIKSFVLSAAVVAVVSLAGISVASADDTITIGTVGSGSALDWPLLVGVEKGFFKNDGLTLDVVSAPSSAAVQQQLAAGSLNMGTGGLVDPIRAIDKGAPISILRIEAQSAPYELYVKPSIKSYADLKGKTIIVGGVKDVTRIYLERMAEANGLKPTDYDLIYAGATSARFAALASGAVDGALISAPFNFTAASSGLKSLGTTYDYVKDFPFTGYSVNTGWAKAHHQAVQEFLTAYVQSVKWLNDPVNRDEADKILVDKTGAKPDDASKTYDFFKKIAIYGVDGVVDQASLGTLLHILKDLGDVTGSTDASRFYDASLVSKD